MDGRALKTQLQHIREQGFKPPPESRRAALVEAMLEHIGVTDAELRDRLIYSTFVHWIELNPVFSPAELRHLLTTLLDKEHLWRGIGAAEGDAVFTRSFSALTIPLIMIHHRDHPFLSPGDVHEVKRQLLRYLLDEKDLRGYVAGKGWAHSLAHAADALNELALCPELGIDDLLDILTAMRAKMITSGCVLMHAEPERFVQVVDSIFSRGLLTVSQWNDWLATFPGLIAPGDPNGYYGAVNANHFLSSLYIHAREATWSSSFVEAVRELRATIHERLHL